jgi:succinylarginine dihydrolase
MSAVEVNFDGLVGPTHNYAGLSYGNEASERHRASPANPRAAALQGLEKMRVLHDLGVPQAVLPPQERPAVAILRRLGFVGGDSEVIATAHRTAPRVFAACCSASAMWTANAATVSPSADTRDGRVHFTPANLVNKFHRSLEPDTTAAVLQAIFPDPARFAHHPPLPAADAFGDEGAANHTRLCAGYGLPGVEMFVYGKRAFAEGDVSPRRYPARQTREAAEAVARLHGLDLARAVFAQQHPDAVDAGVFHNDVVAVGNVNLLFYHGQAFHQEQRLLQALNTALAPTPLETIRVDPDQVSLGDAVRSYLFNSQLVCPATGGTTLVVPFECEQVSAVRACLDWLRSGETAVGRVEVLDLRQSMQNGGGPACLRLRVVLSPEELAAVAPGVKFGPQLHETLVDWVERHYRDHLTEADLPDEALLLESRAALDELTGILGLGAIYPFQKEG